MNWDLNFERLEGDLFSLIEIPSVSGNEQAISNFVRDTLKKSGLKPKQDKMGNVIIQINGKHEGKHVILNGHLDTVPPGKGWKGDPYKARQANGRIYGLGSADMKAGLAIMMELSRIFHSLKRNFCGKVTFAFTVGEEVEDHKRHGAYHITKKLKGDFALVLEPSQQDDSKNICVKVGNGGRCILNVKIHGKAAHSGRPFLGVNALEVGSLVVNKIRKEAPKIKKFKIKELGVSFRPGFSVTKMSVDDSPSNVIPDYCELTIDRRTVPGEERTEIITQVRSILDSVKKESGIEFKYELKLLGYRRPVLMPLDSKLLKTLMEKVEKRYSYTPRLLFSLGTSDAGYFEKSGTPTLSFGPGDLHHIHKANEHVSKAGLRAYALICMDMISDVCEVGK